MRSWLEIRLKWEIQAPFLRIFFQQVLAGAHRCGRQTPAPHQVFGQQKGLFHLEIPAVKKTGNRRFRQVPFAKPKHQLPAADQMNGRRGMRTGDGISFWKTIGNQAYTSAGTILAGGSKNHFHFYFPNESSAGQHMQASCLCIFSEHLLCVSGRLNHSGVYNDRNSLEQRSGTKKQAGDCCTFHDEQADLIIEKMNCVRNAVQMSARQAPERQTESGESLPRIRSMAKSNYLINH